MNTNLSYCHADRSHNLSTFEDQCQRSVKGNRDEDKPPDVGSDTLQDRRYTTRFCILSPPSREGNGRNSPRPGTGSQQQMRRPVAEGR